MTDKIKRIIKSAVVVLVIIGISGLLNFVLSPISYGHWAMHDTKKLEGTIDTVIIGDSLPLYSVQPSILDKKLGCRSFNASSASQYMDETYYLLLDYIKTENIKTVFLGLDYYNFLKEAEDGNSTSARIVYSRLRNPSVKLSYLKEFLNPDEAWDWVFQTRTQINKIAKIPTNVKAKLSSEYRNYLTLSNEEFLMDGGTYYFEKGYVRTDRCNELYVEGIHDMKDMSDKNIEWLIKIIELCKENDLKLYMFHTPLKSEHLKATGNYDLFYKKVCKIAETYGCKYCDFNFYPERDKMPDETHFVNDTHLNYTGSLMFMDWLCREFSE